MLAVGCAGADSEDIVVVGSESGPSPVAGLAHCDEVPKLESRFEGTLSGRQNPDLAAKRALSAYGREHPGTYAGQWIDRGQWRCAHDGVHRRP